MEELWKDIKGYEGLYQVSNLGRVKSLYRNIILKGFIDQDGYRLVTIYRNNTKSNKRIHRLVAQAFIPNPENKSHVNHIDEDKTNNRVDNLEWMTAKENINYGTHNERVSKTMGIPVIAINCITGESKEFHGISECARQLGLCQQSISKVLAGQCRQTGGFTFKYKEE